MPPSQTNTIQSPLDSTTLSSNSLTFITTKAHIRESLAFPFSIECEGYMESMQSDILGVLTPQSSHIPMPSAPSRTLLHPNSLLYTQASFSFSKPYTKSATLTLDTTTNIPKTYNGIITQATYLGTLPHTNHTTSSFADTAKEANTAISINHTGSIDGTTKCGYKHFFSFRLDSHLITLSYNNAKRIYTNTTIIEVIKSLLHSHTSLLHKTLDFSFLQAQYPLQEIITQYDESDLAFITRLAHNNGIYFYEDSTTLYICDTIPTHIAPSSHAHTTQDSLHTNPSHPQSHFFSHTINTSSDTTQPSSYGSSHSQSIRTLLYNPNTTNTLNEECVSKLLAYNALKPKSFSSAYNRWANPLDITHSYRHTPYNTAASPISLDTMQASSLMHHSYESTFSFTHNPNITDSLHLKDSHTQMLDALFNATSNIANLNLTQRVSLQHTTQTTDTSFCIIAIEHTLISKEQATLKQALLPQELSHTTNTQSSTLTLDSTQHNALHSTLHSSLSHTLSYSHSNESQQSTNHYYSNTLTLLPSHIHFIPPSKPKPIPPSTTQGIVIGEGYIQAKNLQEANASIINEANTIYTDSYGRVQVRLHSFYAYALSQEALSNQRTRESDTTHTHSQDSPLESHTTRDSYTQTNDVARESSAKDSLTQEKQSLSHSLLQSLLTTHTPFLRVVSPIASSHSGLYHTPRVGDEVIISYIDNDIDKPYILGSLYNQSNPSLAHLPKQDHITTLSSKTIGSNEQGRNEITLSNQKDKEVITLKAQKDYVESINNNFLQTINNNKDSITLGNYTESIHKAHIQNITLAKNVKVGGEYLTNVALSKDTFVGLSHSLSVGVDNALRVTGDSSESVGGDKRVEIGNNLSSNIGGDLHTTIKGNSEIIINGDKQDIYRKSLIITITRQYLLL